MGVISLSQLFADYTQENRSIVQTRREIIGTAVIMDIGELITSSPEIRGGRPRVAGTGITVMRIAGWHRLGFIPEEIARKTDLSLAQIHAALAYYHANQQAIDAELDDEAALYDRLAAEHGRKNQPQE